MIKVNVILSPYSNADHRRVIEIMSGSSVYKAIMQAKSEGLAVYEHRRVFHNEVRVVDENSVAVVKNSVIVIFEQPKSAVHVIET